MMPCVRVLVRYEEPHHASLCADHKVIKDETLNILLAGRDTTAGTLTFLVYFMAQYPHVYARVREEVLNTVGPTSMPTFEDVKEMKYLRAVINGKSKRCAVNVSASHLLVP